MTLSEFLETMVEKEIVYKDGTKGKEFIFLDGLYSVYYNLHVVDEYEEEYKYSYWVHEDDYGFGAFDAKDEAFKELYFYHCEKSAQNLANTLSILRQL